MNKGKITQKVFRPGALPEMVEPFGDEGVRYEEQAARLAEGPPAGRFAGRKAYIETYGCQMNFSDTEIIASVLRDQGFTFTSDENAADLVLLNTCAIRENAEDRIWARLKNIKGLKRIRPGIKVGVIGCMAERLKEVLIEKEKLVDIVVGPDSYRDLPALLEEADGGQKAINVFLSRDETYNDISPIRLNSNGVTAFISIMRGCDNMCAFCVVPFTRGRERSRDWHTILEEAKELVGNGYKEVTLLGQNVDSYKFEDCSFAGLLEKVAQLSPDLRVRFSTSHPKDITEEVMEVMARYDNICNNIHLPVQSGNSRILELMRRGYDREWYLDKVAMLRKKIPGVTLSTDIITGFCSETEEEHQDTLSLIEAVGFHQAYMFFYSERPGTLAARKYPDDVPYEVKKRRLQEVIDLQSKLQKGLHESQLGKIYKVLVEGNSKRSDTEFCGRNDANQMVIFPKNGSAQPGSYVNVRINSVSPITLKGEIV